MQATIEEPVRRAAGQGEARILRHGSFRCDRTLEAAMADLLSPTYEHAGALLERELHRADTAYVYYHDERPVFFLLTAHHELRVGDDESIPCTYMGLSAGCRAHRRSGAMRTLYVRAVVDQLEWQQAHGRRGLLWATTAALPAFHVARVLTERFEPHADGGYSERGVRLAAAMRHACGLAAAEAGDHPFVLRGAATDAKRSDVGRQLVARSCERKNFTLLRDLEVEHARGDCLLGLGWLPAPATASR